MSEASPPSARGSNYITPEGYERLRAEHLQLWKVERPLVTRQVSVAAALGDRSENADYIYGKRRLREIDSRLRFLEKRMEALQVVHPDSNRDRDRVFFGAWVTLADEAGEEVRYRVVGPDESRPGSGLISMDSPVGRALLGKSVGDELTIKRPRGAIDYEVVTVSYEAPAETPG
ncbi:MAG: transcription elongation factor GreB [Myxococcota bacterium]|nr:transcription elongation factor GreB [Myxococcota bacterium]